jgi:hypothetical protein
MTGRASPARAPNLSLLLLVIGRAFAFVAATTVVMLVYPQAATAGPSSDWLVIGLAFAFVATTVVMLVYWQAVIAGPRSDC